ncbi:MAG TPA: hypothetical protein VG013_27850, partial [Gemmataceae bacterium]|nr:hypothetical protein [Gemmataceae bacterium]
MRQKGGKWQLEAGYLGGWGISIIDAKHEFKLFLRIKDALPKADYEKYVDKTTAGPEWEDYALSYFVTLNGKPHFCIRTWWDRRILIDLEAPRQVSDRPFEKPLAASEKQRALASLKEGLTLNWQKTTLDRIQVVHAAAHFAGRAKMKEAVRLLRQLEPVDYIGSCGGGRTQGLREGD